MTAGFKGGQSKDGGIGYEVEQSPTLSATPSALEPTVVTAYGIDQQGGKGGANYSEDVTPPILSDSHGTPHAVAYGISAYESNAMKSSNPHSGIYEADTARTLDLNGGSPACNQGGVAVVAFSQNQREEVRDLGDVAGSVNAEEGIHQRTFVAVDCRNGTENECTNGTLQAKSNGGFNTNSNNIVRVSLE